MKTFSVFLYQHDVEAENPKQALEKVLADMRNRVTGNILAQVQEDPEDTDGPIFSQVSIDGVFQREAE